MQRNSPGAARDGGPVVLRPVRATPCLHLTRYLFSQCNWVPASTRHLLLCQVRGAEVTPGSVIHTSTRYHLDSLLMFCLSRHIFGSYNRLDQVTKGVCKGTHKITEDTSRQIPSDLLHQ